MSGLMRLAEFLSLQPSQRIWKSNELRKKQSLFWIRSFLNSVYSYIPQPIHLLRSF